ncbi:MAG: hypothetical protein HC817_06430 [Saprospiraceae bacterium]|nr:hypothetical protein [Saprospiraceae bacterium]
MRTEPTVINGRNTLRADVVGFLTVGNYGGTRGIVSNSNPGGVDPLANYPNDDLSFFISQAVNADQANVFTAAHEFGHLFKARHQRSTTAGFAPDDFGGSEHGFSWRTRTTCAFRALGICFNWNYDRRASIMHTTQRFDGSDESTRYIRSLFYSNPLVNQPGTSTYWYY